MAMTAWAAKVFKKLDLLVRKRTNLHAANNNRSYGNSLTQQRRAIRSEANSVDSSGFRKLVFSRLQQIRNMDRLDGR